MKQLSLRGVDTKATKQSLYNLKRILFIPICFLCWIMGLLPPTYVGVAMTFVHAQEMNSQNFRITGGNLNMTSGNKSSANFKLSDVVGQTVAGTFASKGYIINAGFQNSAGGEIFSFSVGPPQVDFGELIPNTPVEKTIKMTISNGNVPGYTVKVSENQPLSTSLASTIPDTVCDVDSPCTLTQSNKWNQNSAFGLGYKISGPTSPKDFKNNEFYRPFPASTRSEQSAVVMESKARKVSDQSTMTVKVNIGRSQPVGQYQNVLSFSAMAGI